MNEIQLAELSTLVEKLTTCKKDGPDEEKLKILKKKCKSSEECLKHTYHLVAHQLQKPHSEIRLNALIIANELFIRSHAFRELLVSDFQTFLEMTVETDPDQPLPPPLASAKTLKVKTFQHIQEWHKKFGDGYRKLQLGYTFLKNCKRVDFNHIEAATIGERQREEIKKRYVDQLDEKKAKEAQRELNNLSINIEDYLIQLENCFQLLLPHPNDFFVKSDFNEIEAPSEPSNLSLGNINKDDCKSLREHGFTDNKFSVEINLPHNISVAASEDNKDVIETTKEVYKLVSTKFLPAVEKLIRVFCKTGKKPDSLKYAIDIKEKLTNAVEKFRELNIEVPKEEKCKEQKDSDESDFEEVPEKEGYEPVIPQHLRREYGLETSPILPKKPRVKSSLGKWTFVERGEDDFKDPTTVSAQPSCSKFSDLRPMTNSLEEKSETAECSSVSNQIKDPKKAELLKIAPKLRYDMDLYVWEEEKLVPPSVIRYDDLHEFWAHNDNASCTKSLIKEEDVNTLRCRVMDFSGKFEKVKWSCRAPLPSGRLCPRQDRIKCPFHGIIISRDHSGNPTNEADLERMAETQKNKVDQNSDWQDPKLLEDIKAEIGIDLKIVKKGKGGPGKKTKRKHSDLTDIKKIRDTSRSRLEKKVLSKASVKRIEDSANAEKQKVFDDKFGDQWNYSMLNLR